MPVSKGTVTTTIVQNLSHLVNQYNRREKEYVRNYNNFMRERNHLLEQHNGIFETLLNDQIFCNLFRGILTKFGLNARGSRLVSSQQILESITEYSPEFDRLRSANILLHTLNLHQTIENQTIDSIIRNIFCFFAEPHRITESGGFVAASKNMHFIMPELFIILDGQHIAMSLYNINRIDYNPHPEDGIGWINVVPNFSRRKKPNPYPQGEGRRSWDAERYVIALMYYKRIIHEWCQGYCSDFEGFLEIDFENASTASRIIDKALW